MAPAGRPTPSLSWYINGEPAPPNYLTLSDSRDQLNLKFSLDVQHLDDGKARVVLSCKASLAYNYSTFETNQTDEIFIQTNDSSPTPSVTPLFISGLKDRYYVGDTLRITCSYLGKHDDFQLHWRMNDRKVLPKYVVQYDLNKYIGLNLTIHKRDLNSKNQVSVKCAATKTFWRDRFKTSGSGMNLEISFKLILMIVLSHVFRKINRK